MKKVYSFAPLFDRQRCQRINESGIRSCEGIWERIGARNPFNLFLKIAGSALSTNLHKIASKLVTTSKVNVVIHKNPFWCYTYHYKATVSNRQCRFSLFCKRANALSNTMTAQCQILTEGVA